MTPSDALPTPALPWRPTWAVMLLACVALVALALVALASGRYPLSPLQVARVVWHRLLGGTEAGITDAIVWQIRMPRVAIAMLVGAALAAAGAAYQHLFRNPLVAPDTLGVSSGAALGAVLGIFLGAGYLAIEAAAFAGGLGAVAIVMFIASRLTAHEPLVTLILTGVVVASLLGAAISLLKYLADPYNELPAITFWLMGSFAASSPRELASALPAVLLALLALVALAWRINLLALPEEEARALGVNTRRLRGIVIAAATLATSASVAVSGIIGWVGLVVPHMARLLVGPEFSRLLPIAAILGAMFTLVIDTIARSLATIEVPPGILTAVVGTPVFIALLARAARAT
ncbi:MAG TPA: iron ABC transporter permease [Casimicrobiaceae bacterium]|nr:iron ABC transporter permease [Casimicrobiaceae bacterium]